MITKDIPLFGYFLYTIVILAWSMAYYLSYYISRPKLCKVRKDEPEQTELLLDTARRTWQFFKILPTKETNWLCPDNYQISQVEKVSDKTSPTNIGLQFLAILSARDFGYETITATVDRIENLMVTVQKLMKWKGHLYNWYQIRTLEVLNPAYISTVDSGNYSGTYDCSKKWSDRADE